MKNKKVYIEVKRTTKKGFSNFYITINELRASLECKDKYYVCKISDAKGEQKYTQGAIDKNFKLNAIQYEAVIEKE